MSKKLVLEITFNANSLTPESLQEIAGNISEHIHNESDKHFASYFLSEKEKDQYWENDEFREKFVDIKAWEKLPIQKLAMLTKNYKGKLNKLSTATEKFTEILCCTHSDPNNKTNTPTQCQYYQTIERKND